ncbi:MAG TPA: type III-B CRISPR module RAMP protein Cmr1 [Acetivibrio sp.]|nr:type III-B CRISPR module RAMP protein Cmr1 [Acetivibrio sp.]
MEQFTVQIKPLTPLWTGDANKECRTLRETGIIGSLRWWYEALIRGLGGSACDPTNSKCNGKDHCDACELFGCTGWARKFRLEVEKFKESELVFKFTSLRKPEDIEWALLDKTIKIISEYGAIGGKFADPEYGVIKIQNNDLHKFICKKADIDMYFKKHNEDIYSPSLSMFIFSKDDKITKEIANIKESFTFLKGTKGKGRKFCCKRYINIDEKAKRFFLYTDNAEQYAEIKQYIDKSAIKYIEGKKLLEELR